MSSAWTGVRKVKEVGARSNVLARLRERRMTRRLEWRAGCMLVLNHGAIATCAYGSNTATQDQDWKNSSTNIFRRKASPFNSLV